MTTVIINDFSTDRRVAILFNHPQDFTRVDAYWEVEDKLLVNLSELNVAFKDRRRWCDLSPTHYRFLIMENLNKVAALSDEDQANDTNPTMVSLTFILTAFIKLLENVTESTIELLRINRLGEHEVLYDYSGSINMHLDSIRPKRDGLRVIVDNT
jgi:hypothetical protein